ncbi:hypothetical protein NON00_20305 [Roseomonas sp. GC11]|uniref:four-carbon acid sugar kinase family protein n=1 Tax=Roseomonas sp. GC11 TaxID=2950546 RepID=UPI00210F0D80|nr:four-carbon acid sugar kinase family protein [Roseomonas sp. GC11]MCQ4162259.1 hypothetical protein [Roseomonas sp. GC11]
MPLLGCLADDLPGATDLAAMLVAQGMRTVLTTRLPEGPLPETDALVIAAPEAQRLAACEALLAAGARQILLHLDPGCRGLAAGQLGPVADALLHRLQAGFALVCPAFPALGATVYQGHLFLGAALASTGEPSLMRALAQQTEGATGLLPFAVVEQGLAPLRQALHRLRDGGRRYAIADALTEAHLHSLGAACAGHPLVIGGTGLAMALPQNFRAAGLLPDRADAEALPAATGTQAVLASASTRATLGQIGFARLHGPVLELDPLATPEPGALLAQALAWLEGKLSATRPVVITTATAPERAAALQARLGEAALAALLDKTLGDLAAALVERGVGQLVAADEAAAGAVLGRLGITRLRVGAQIDPGLPWSYSDEAGLHLALKPGHSGARDFFLKAFPP